MANGGWRPHIESALCLDLPQLFRNRTLAPSQTTSGVLVWSRDGQRIASVGYSASLGDVSGNLVLTYRADSQEGRDDIRLSSVPNHYGGRNWFLHCPATGRRARKLYKWAGLSHFRHREAVRPRPTYSSQRDSGLERINRQRWKLRQRMGDEWSDLFGEPYKPKGMHRQTFERYAARDAELEGREGPHWSGLLARLSGKVRF